MILVGDIGGTKTILAVYSVETGLHQPLVEKTYPSTAYASLESIVHQFLSENNLPVERGCFGVAGPVIAGQARITNLPWVIDANRLMTEFGWASASLLNDLEAVAYAIPVLENNDLYTLNPGIPVQGGSIAVLAPGTGLGEAFMTHHEGKYHAHPSEGSHASFSPMGATQEKLLIYLREQKGFSHVSFERVCSGGLGIPNLYAFLKDIQAGEEPAWLAEQLAQAEDPTPIIISAAQDPRRSSALCSAVLDLFIEILGVEAGNLALKVLATGGLYLGGGISPRIVEQLKTSAFLPMMYNKGRFEDLLKSIPVHVILNKKAGLIGAAAFGLPGNQS